MTGFLIAISLIALIFVFPGIYRLVYKEELPSPLYVSVSVAIGTGFVVAGIFGIIKAERVSDIVMTLMLLLVAAGLFVDAGLIIKGIIYLEYTYLHD